MNFLLDIVSDNGTPDYTVSASNNLQKIIEERGDLLLLTLIIGIVLGILISYTYYHVYSTFKPDKEKQVENNEENKN